LGGRLERTHVDLQPVPIPLDPPEDANRVALAEAAVEQLDVAPDPRFDPSARIDELQRQVRRAPTRPPPLLARHGVNPLDDPVLGEGGDRAHAATLRPKPDARVAALWPRSSRSAPSATASAPARSTPSSRLPMTSSRRRIATTTP